MTNQLTTKKAIMPYSPEIGDFFRKKRVKSGYTQAEIAQKLGYASSQMISKFERGLCGLRFSDLSVLVKHLDVPRSEILDVLLREQAKLFLNHFE